MAKFHPLSVSDIRKETNDCISVAFEIPKQFEEDYRFIPGQYVTLKLSVDGEELKRTYSICSSPALETEIRIAFKRVKNGKVSNYLFEKLQRGDIVDVMTPLGNFHSPFDPSIPKNYMMFAGGSGITPIFSIINTVLHIEPGSKITLFYANRNEESVIFKTQLGNLEKKFPLRLKIFHVLKNPIYSCEEVFSGTLSQEKTETLLTQYTEINSVNEFFICGPLPIMKNIIATLEKFKIAKELIHVEYFTTVLEDIAKAELTDSGPKHPNIASKVTLILDGKHTEFDLNSKGDSILDAGIEQGLDIPYACKSGVCSTCMAKIKEGNIEMEKNYALTDSEIAGGFILTCQSHPVSEKVVVSYDES